MVLPSNPRARRLLVGAGIGAATFFTATAALAQEGSPPEAAANEAATQVQVILDNIWVLIAAVLVIFMQAGFALVEAGLTRGKNVGNIVMKNMMDFVVGVLGFAAFGFAIAFGAGNGLFGTEGWFLNADSFTEGWGNLTLPTFFIFQVAFAATAATIVSGAMAERTKFISYFIYSFIISAFIYPVVVHWVWGGGWLSQLSTPFHDFAGSTVVHSVGGWAALVGAAMLGARIGKYGKDGKPRAIPGHSVPFAIIGVFILLIGWFGFNPGSELAADASVPAIALTTLLAGATGAVVATLVVWFKTGKPDVAMAGNGLLAGLVGITAGCYAVTGWGAVIIGAVAGLIVVFAVFGIDRLRIDDPVGAISVHGICGAWGTLAVGLFSFEDKLNADGGLVVKQGLFYGGGADQLVSQVIGIVSVFAYVLVAAGILFGILKATIGLRVSPQEEIEGLDVHEHGAPGYAEDVLAGLDWRDAVEAAETADAKV
ncbi:MAG: ammonium transporter [Acidimicrobiales bacterium]